MLSNLNRLSRSLRSLIAVTIWLTLPHTAWGNAPRYWKRISINVSRTGIDSFSTLIESEGYVKTRKPTYSESRMLYSSLDGIRRRMDGPNFSWSVFQFRPLRIRSFSAASFIWYSSTAPQRFLRVDCKSGITSSIIFFRACVSARSKVEIVCDCPFSEKVANRLGAFLVRTERECWCSSSSFILWVFSDTRKYRRRTDVTENWVSKLFRAWTTWRTLLVIWEIGRFWFCRSVIHILLSWSKEFELSMPNKSRVNSHMIAESSIEHRSEKTS